MRSGTFFTQYTQFVIKNNYSDYRNNYHVKTRIKLDWMIFDRTSFLFLNRIPLIIQMDSCDNNPLRLLTREAEMS